MNDDMTNYYNTWDYYNNIFEEDMLKKKVNSGMKLGPPSVAKMFFSDYETKPNRFIVASDETSVISAVRYNENYKSTKGYFGYKIVKSRVRYCLVYDDGTVSSYYESKEDFTEEDLSKPHELFYYVPDFLFPEDKLIRRNDKNIIPTNKVFEKEKKKRAKDDDSDDEESEDDEFQKDENLAENDSFVNDEILSKIGLYVDGMNTAKDKTSIKVDIDHIRMMISSTILMNNLNFL